MKALVLRGVVITHITFLIHSPFIALRAVSILMSATKRVTASACNREVPTQTPGSSCAAVQPLACPSALLVTVPLLSFSGSYSGSLHLLILLVLYLHSTGRWAVSVSALRGRCLVISKGSFSTPTAKTNHSGVGGRWWLLRLHSPSVFLTGAII